MDEIFSHWKTLAAFAEDIGAEYYQARQWKQRRSIPARFDLRIVAAAERRGFPVTLEKLAHLRAAEAGLEPLSSEGVSAPAR